MGQRGISEKSNDSGKESPPPLQQTVKVSEAELAVRRQAVEAAYLEEYPRLHRMMMPYLGKKTGQSRSVCEERVVEALQETYIRLMGLLDKFDPNAPAGPWVRSVAYFVLKEQNPARKPKAPALAADLHKDGFAGLEPIIKPWEPSPSDDFFSRAEVNEWRTLADRLPPDQRDAVVLTVFEGLSAGEAAERLKVEVETIHVRKSRGLTNLRKLHEEKQGGPQAKETKP